MAFWTLLLLFLALFAAGPWWPHSRGWGATPAAILLVVLLAWLAAIWVGGVAFEWPWTPTLTPPPDLPT